MDNPAITDSLVESVLNHTPAFYSVVDEAFNVLYVSDNYAGILGRTRQELLSGKCFEMVGKGGPCYIVDGSLCPVARAFQTGERQYSLLEEDLRGRRLYFDNYAVPIEMEGPDGESVRCCLEILFDRTREREIQGAFENDLGQLVEKMSSMVEEILPEVSANAQEIIREADRFGKYLGGVRGGPFWRGRRPGQGPG
jgi:hypothetical protein